MEGIIGKTNFDLFPPELAAKYNADDQRVIETGETHDVVEAHQTPTKKIFVQVIKTPVRDGDGRVIGTQAIFWDVTERKAMEEQLHYERELLRGLSTPVRTASISGPGLAHVEGQPNRWPSVSV
jgi:hypothetical protein